MQVTELWVDLQDKKDMSPFDALQKIKETRPKKDSLELCLFLSSFRHIDDAYRWMKMENNKRIERE